MFVFLLALIPVFMTLGFYLWKPHEFAKWELVFPTAVTVIAIIIAKVTTQAIHTNFTEYWGEKVYEAYESEPWNEWIDQTCETCTTDSDGNETCVEYDCSYQDDHGPSWWIQTEYGSRNINEKQYDELLAQWGTGTTVERTRRNYSPNDRAYYSEGTKFAGTYVGQTSRVLKTKWSGSEETLRAFTSKHTYVNKIKASDLSIFHITVVSEEEVDSLGLYRYPKVSDGLEYPTILSRTGIPRNIQQEYQRLNAKFGKSNQLRLWILVYQNQPELIAEYQRNYWVNGNKNELVVCVGVDNSGNIEWTQAFSWAISQDLVVDAKVALRDMEVLNGNTFDKYYEWLDGNLGRFVRREFAEFDYIKVEPPTWAIVMIVIIAIVFSLGTNFYAISNDFDKDGDKSDYRRRWRR